MAANTMTDALEPYPASVVSEQGDVAAQAERALLASVVPTNSRAAAEQWLTDVRASLSEPGDTGLERLLVQRIALYWLAVNAAEQRRTAWDSSPALPLVSDKRANDTAELLDKRVSRLNADLLRAVRTLAQVRKLRRPVLQVNIAEQQVIAGNVERKG